jgi:hypothetical protein
MRTGTKAGSGVGLSIPTSCPAHPPLQDERDDAVGGGDRHEVEQGSLGRDGDAAERDEQQEQADADDHRQQERDAAHDVGVAVQGRGGRPADVGGAAGPGHGGRQHVGAQPLDQLGGPLVLRPGHGHGGDEGDLSISAGNGRSGRGDAVDVAERCGDARRAGGSGAVHDD